jgi:hypothetical protein
MELALLWLLGRPNIEGLASIAEATDSGWHDPGETMEDLQDPVPRAQDKSTFKSLFDDLGNSLIVLATITVVSLIVLIIVWRLHPSRDSLGFELAKTSMQALGVIVVGAMAGIATFTYQHKRLRAAEIRDQQHEDWRREVDRIMDERRRQDELLRSVLNDTLAAYHAVKRTRRLLAAETGPEQKGPVSFEIYDQYMLSINDEQLEFEKLKMLADIIDDSRLPRTPPWPDAREKDKDKAPLVAMFSKIEHSLNELVDEYKDRRLEVKQAGSIPLPQLTQATLFVTSHGFRAAISRPKDAVVKLLQTALLKPIHLPTVAEVVAASLKERRERQPSGSRPDLVAGPEAPLPAARAKNGDGQA